MINITIQPQDFTMAYTVIIQRDNEQPSNLCINEADLRGYLLEYKGPDTKVFLVPGLLPVPARNLQKLLEEQGIEYEIFNNRR